MLDVQVRGVWNVLRATVPLLRAQRDGHVLNVSSVLGLTVFPGWGLYCAGTFALEGLTEALSGEVAEFGVRVALVEPGYFRTEFLSPASRVAPSSRSGHYPGIEQMVQQHRDLQGNQPGDPDKGAQALVDLVDQRSTRLRHLLGSDALGLATDRVAALAEEISRSRGVAPTTDRAHESVARG